MGEKKPYVPCPIDTGCVQVPAEVEELGEYLARNVHEVWARQRLGEGWQYGKTLSRENKIHPSLVPYEELPESEKDYDRNTCMETLKAILALGFEIKKKETKEEK